MSLKPQTARHRSNSARNDFKKLGQTLRTSVRQCVRVGAADPDSRRAQRQRDDHVGGIAHPRVEHHRGTNRWFVPDFVAERGRDRDHGLEL
jgi:hypothetical protein